MTRWRMLRWVNAHKAEGNLLAFKGMMPFGTRKWAQRVPTGNSTGLVLPITTTIP